MPNRAPHKMRSCLHTGSRQDLQCLVPHRVSPSTRRCWISMWNCWGLGYVHVARPGRKRRCSGLPSIPRWTTRPSDHPCSGPRVPGRQQWRARLTSVPQGKTFPGCSVAPPTGAATQAPIVKGTRVLDWASCWAPRVFFSVIGPMWRSVRNKFTNDAGVLTNKNTFGRAPFAEIAAGFCGFAPIRVGAGATTTVPQGNKGV